MSLLSKDYPRLCKFVCVFRTISLLCILQEVNAMKIIINRNWLLAIIILIIQFSLYGQQIQSKMLQEGGYSYEIVEGDPTQTRIYTLANGLKVYLSVYKDKPRIQTYIAVRAGSKNDPATATGLAHYLEHMVFKGTSKIGAIDYAKEKVLLDSIENLYERYRKTVDPKQRQAIYKKIDQTSLAASKLAIANEYDKLMSYIGAKGTNAYTWHEQTVYVNDIPSNQLNTWLEIEKERFSELVPRLFHTELEAVYEEKNISLDSDREKVEEAMMSTLFKKHQYGTQTTIGTIQHLKNPSIKEIKKYFYTYYVPNNMAICLSGDLDPTETIKAIDATFGKLASKPVPKFIPAVEAPLVGPVVKKAIGPEEESVTIAFRFPGATTRDAMLMSMVDMILSNSQAGLIDLNLNQAQKILEGYSYAMKLKDYSVHILGGQPREGQSMEQVQRLLLAQLDSIKKGKFEDWLLEAIVNNLNIERQQSFESNGARAGAYVDAFIKNRPWIDYITELEQLSKITKKDIIEFANKNYNNNYVAVYKATGKDPNVKKVPKPSITPIELNRDKSSAFFKEIVARKTAELEPVFLDFSTDINKSTLKPGINVLYKKNEENQLFKLYYLFEMGTNHNPEIGLAINYLEYLGTSKYKPEQLKKEFYKLGTSYSVFSSEDRIYVSLTGLQSNFEKSVALFESLLNDPVGNEEALKNLVQDILKLRQNAKLDKQQILWNGLVNYAQYGPKSPFTNILSKEALQAMRPDKLLDIIKRLKSYEHLVMYYGPDELSAVNSWLSALHTTPDILSKVPIATDFMQIESEPKVYWVNYDMVQAEIVFLSKSEPFNPAKVPVATLFNEYFGGDMSSVVFQEIRESKALAYSSFGAYRLARDKRQSNYVLAYLGTQSDKLPEAMKAMRQILNNLPENESSFESARTSVINKLRTERITKSQVFFSYLNAQKQGLEYDIRKEIFQQASKMNFGHIRQFHEEYIKDKNFVICVVGSKDKLDFKTLSEYGTVKELSLSDVFGY
jgi:predicted Zn-dependent peptidase